MSPINFMESVFGISDVNTSHFGLKQPFTSD
jgi:hypothetical protein